MKKYKILILVALIIILSACTDLNLNPLSEGSSENWYSNETEIEMAVNDLYRRVFWVNDRLSRDMWTDDWMQRNALNEVTGGTITGQWSAVTDLWLNSYKAIARANVIIDNIQNYEGNIAQSLLNKYEAEARFVRASMYSTLIAHFGDVVYYERIMNIEESFTTGRTDKTIILQSVYSDYDYAIANLPVENSNSALDRATKGIAMAMKARIALYMNDWQTAKSAAKACMDLGVYELYPDFRELFLSKTRNPIEVLFLFPSVSELDATYPTWPPGPLTRNAGGYAMYNPSFELLASFLCTDGLPIDESPLFDPHNPFKNRDPRCSETIVEFQTEHLGFMYQPHPDSLQVLNFSTGKYQKNNDNRANAIYASWNGLVFRKFIDEDWKDQVLENDIYLMRYADVLLMYAEASIELNQIDQSVVDAMNMVRARAYKVNKDQTSIYPAITTTNQSELRKILRVERRMEFAWEGLRYMDILRWRIAEIALNKVNYGILDPAELRQKVVKQGHWFWAQTPEIDENGIANFDPMFNAGFIKVLAVRSFDPERQYLWPIPTKEILINSNLEQNPGY
jgi:starch-binding outer membrane protein, SusD/RagB family